MEDTLRVPVVGPAISIRAGRPGKGIIFAMSEDKIFLEVPGPGGKPIKIPFAAGERLRTIAEVADDAVLLLSKEFSLSKSQRGFLRQYLRGAFTAQHKNAAEYFYRLFSKFDETIPREEARRACFEYAQAVFSDTNPRS